LVAFNFPNNLPTCSDEVGCFSLISTLLAYRLRMSQGKS